MRTALLTIQATFIAACVSLPAADSPPADGNMTHNLSLEITPSREIEEPARKIELQFRIRNGSDFPVTICPSGDRKISIGWQNKETTSYDGGCLEVERRVLPAGAVFEWKEDFQLSPCPMGDHTVIQELLYCQGEFPVSARIEIIAGSTCTKVQPCERVVLEASTEPLRLVLEKEDQTRNDPL